jgi:hypothetical protein
MSAPQQQCASAVLMIRPAAFDYNPETAATNSMQRRGGAGSGEAQMRAHDEFSHIVHALQSEGIEVCAVDDTRSPPKPDAVFPNNWVSFHQDGTVVLYPMQAESRRRERRGEILSEVEKRLGFRRTRTIDLTGHEASGRFLEGTGSLVLDHRNRVAYATVSPRTNPDVVREWSSALGYEPVLFASADRTGAPIYHTNVLLCIGERVAVVGSGAIAPQDRGRVVERLAASGREVIEVGLPEVEAFAANMLELSSWDEALGDCRVLVMSTTARGVFGAERYARLSGCTDTVLAVPLPTIETLGGGGVRCMLAEVFLPA